jgi:hypothetical protein
MEQDVQNVPAKQKKPNRHTYQPKFGVIVICQDEKHQEQVYNELHGQKYNCKVVTV